MLSVSKSVSIKNQLLFLFHSTNYDMYIYNTEINLTVGGSKIIHSDCGTDFTLCFLATLSIMLVMDRAG